MGDHGTLVSLGKRAYNKFDEGLLTSLCSGREIFKGEENMISRYSTEITNHKKHLPGSHEEENPVCPVWIRRILTFWIPGILTSFTVVFMVLFSTAEAALQNQHPVMLEEASSLLEAEYASWVISAPRSYRSGFAEALKNEDPHGIKNPAAAGVEQVGNGGFLVSTDPIPENAVELSADIQDEQVGSSEVPSDNDEPGIPLEDGALLNTDDPEPGIELPGDVQETLENMGISVEDSELSREEARDVVDEVRDQLRPESGDWRDTDPDVLEAVRELQGLQDQMDLPGIRDMR